MRNENKTTKKTKRGGFGHGPSFGIPVEKPKDFKGTLKRLLKYLKPQRFKLIIVFIMAILSTVFAIKSPEIMGRATTEIFSGIMKKINGANEAIINYSYIKNILFYLVILYCFSSLFKFLQQFLMAGVAQTTVCKLREDANEKLNKLPLKYFDQRSTGEVLSRLVNDIDTISNTLQQSITQFITSLATLIGIIVMMFKINWIMTLITFVTLPLSVIFTKKIAKKSQKFFKMQQENLGHLNGHVEEMYTGHVVIQSFGYEDKSIEKFNEINDKLFDASWKAQFISGIIMPVMSFIGNIGYVFVSVVGGLLVTTKGITIGQVQAFIQYSKQFTQPIVQTANIVNLIQGTIASAERVFEILDEDEIEEKALEYREDLDIKGDIEFKDVSFSYEKESSLIEDLSVSVKKGQTVAIVGPTGAGKTTIVNLLMRFYDIDNGFIMIDGIDSNEIGRDIIRNQFGMVLQDTWLFKGSIYDNISYGKENATKEEVYSAAKTAHAHHFIKTLPNGYDTILNEEANNISQGQRQLLTIARALLANPKVLILDEATSSVDTRTELLIQNAMIKLMENRTNFVIAHRLSTIKDADIILVMENGKIVEKGNHKELLVKKGFYYELYNSQFKQSEEIAV